MTDKSALHLAGYEDGVKGKFPWFPFLVNEDIVAGQRHGYEDYLLNKDLAERVAAKTGERSIERVVEVESSREREENEERRHRELVEALENSRDRGDDDYGGDDDDYDSGGYETSASSPNPPSLPEPLIYSEKTKRVSGMERLQEIWATVETEHLVWEYHEYPDHDSYACFDGSAPDGRYRIRLCLRAAASVSKILELENFNVLSSYYPLSEEEKDLANQLARQINILTRVESLYQSYSGGISCYNNAMSCFGKENKPAALAAFSQARVIFERLCNDTDVLSANFSGVPDDFVAAVNNMRSAAYCARSATNEMVKSWESNYFDYINYYSQLSHYHSTLVYNFLYPESQ